MKELNSEGTVKIEKTKTEFAVCDFTGESIDKEEYSIKLGTLKEMRPIRIKIGVEERLADGIEKILKSDEESKLGAHLRIKETINPRTCIVCNKKHLSKTKILRLERKEKIQVHENCLKDLPGILRNIPERYKLLRSIKNL